jgi:serine-type D-Ala-D-Ala carboxypeptidase (penicillin-binding protein 5/6)
MFRRLGYLFCFLFIFLQANAFSTKAQYAFLIDATTGSVLYKKNAYKKMAPSSMSKLMTLYITFERLQNGSMKLPDKILVSTKAWRMGGTRMFLPPNTFVSVEDLLRGVIVQSGNDASVVLAEGIAGSEKDFAALMNAKALELGLKQTHFSNATGLPNKDHYMSAADIATLSAKIIKNFPKQYHYFSETEFTFNNIKQSNRNTLLNINGVDGLKTGNTDAGKYGVVVSASQDGRRLIAVINGARNVKERAIEAQRLLQYGFLNYSNIAISKKLNALDQIPVFLGEIDKVNFGTKEPIIFTIPLTKKGKTQVKVKYPSIVYAPIDMSKKIGDITIKLYDGQTYNLDLYPAKEVKKVGFLKEIFVKIKTWFQTFSFSPPKSNEKTRDFMI